MALDGEIDEVENCPDCGSSIPVSVQRSNAGYYLGQWCTNCGPHSRLTGYFANRLEADLALGDWESGDRSEARDTDYHGG